MSTDIASKLVHAQLEEAARDHPDRPWVTFTRGGSHTFEDVHQASLRVAAGLQRRGVTKGDRVAFVIGNRIEFLQVWFACHRAGALAVPLNTALRGATLTHMLNLARPKVVVCEATYLHRVVQALDDEEYVDVLVLIDGDDEIDRTRSRSALETFDSLFDGAELSPVQISSSDPSAIMYTSGTTGPSKGVVWSHASTLAMAQTTVQGMAYDSTDVLYTCLPLLHANALTVATIPSLLARARIVISPRFSAGEFWPDIARHQVTATNLLGAMTSILLKQATSPLERQHTLRTALVIPAPASYYEVLPERFGVAPVQAYGLTDFGMLLWAPQDGSGPPGSCGRPVDDFEVCLVDEFDHEVADGEPGELVARPLKPWVAPLGYWAMPEATVAATRNLWFHTGDVLVRDDAGWFYFADRAKDSIRRRGENISSFEVEQAFMLDDRIAECAAYAVPSELTEDEVAIAIVRVPGSSVEPIDLVKLAETRLPYFAVPRFVRLMDSLPKTETEKVMKAELRREGLGGSDVWDREAAGYNVRR